MTPLFDESLLKHGISDHFPSTPTLTSLLCYNCSQNQYKIIQLLNAFEGTSKQQALYAKRVEEKYPLCATCNYRVAQKLQQSQEQALHYQRQNALKSPTGADWRSKLKLAQNMRWLQMQRKLLRASFFIPELLFQLYLIVKVISGSSQESLFPSFSIKLAQDQELYFWLPESGSFSSLFFAFAFALLAWQVIGAGWNARGVSAVMTQVIAFAFRSVVANYLFLPASSGVSKYTAAVLAAMGLALVFKTGSRNGQFRSSKCSNLQVIRSQSLDSPTITRSSLLTAVDSPSSYTASPTPNGFAKYSGQEFQYHSFSNQVSGDIKPYPIKPRPGHLKLDPPKPDFTNLASAAASSSTGVKMRPARLPLSDSLELEPMFSSFSLNDRENNKENQQVRSKIEPAVPSFKPETSTRTVEKPTFNYKLVFHVAYNVAITATLLTCRFLVHGRLPLISVVLAAAFGLRGFVWSRLSMRLQVSLICLAIARLVLLTVELNSDSLTLPAAPLLVLDELLILLR